MIALDSSALVAIATAEEGYERFDQALAASYCIVGAPTLQETHMVLNGGKNVDGIAFIDMLMSLPNVVIIPFAREHFELSRLAFARYGKGRGKRKGLNFGDCLSYAVARAADVPLLFKGDDFLATDIRPALRPVK